MRINNYYLPLIIFSFLFVVIGHIFILQQEENGPTEYLNIRGDSLAYISMIEGEIDTVSPPFKYRLLVPFLSNLLPFQPAESLRLISYASLLIAYFFILLTLTRLGYSKLDSFGGLLVVFTSTVNLYNFHNPYLTDAFVLMILAIMTYAYIDGSFSYFWLAAIIGLLAKETIIFMVPLWFLRNVRQGFFLLFLSILVLLLPRYLLNSTSELNSIIQNISDIWIMRFTHPISFFKEIFMSWGFVWFLFLIGIWLLPNKVFFNTLAAFIFLFFGAILSSLIATDTGRMFLILTPILAIISAQIFMTLRNMGEKKFLILVLVCCLQMITAIPNLFIGEHNWIISHRWIKLFLLFISILLFLGFIINRRDCLFDKLIQKFNYVSSLISFLL